MAEPKSIGKISKDFSPPGWVRESGPVILPFPSSPSRDEFGVFPKYLSCTFKSFQPTPQNREALLACQSWAKDTRAFLFLTGSPGVGKTHLAVATLKVWQGAHRASLPGQFVSAIELLLTIQQCFSQDGSQLKTVQQYIAPPLLVIDDLGAEKATDWTRQIIYYILDKRDNMLRPTILTSNHGLADVAVAYGDKVASRIGSGAVIPLTGEDWRYKKQNRGGPKPNASV